MLPSTLKAVRAILEADPSIQVGERNQLLAVIRNGANNAKSESATDGIARIIRRGEAAARLSCSLRTIDKLHAQGILKKHRLPGRQRSSGFLESDVTGLITEKEAAHEISPLALSGRQPTRGGKRDSSTTKKPTGHS